RPEEDADYAFSRFDERGRCYYFVGFEVDAPIPVPSGAVSVTIPQRLCAKATHTGPPAETLGRTLDYLYGEWFLGSTYRTGHDRDMPYPVIEYYDGRTGSSPPEMDVFIPLKRPDDRIVDVKAYEAAAYRAVGPDRAKLKLEAFDKMINWVERQSGRLAGAFELGARYGEVDAHDSFCEA